MYSKIVIMFLFFNSCYCNKLFEFIKYPKDQPTGTMNYSKIPQDYFLSNNLIIKFFKKTYNRHTNFAIENIDKNRGPTFGETFSFSPLSHCDNEYNKNVAIQCLQDNPSNWWCIYDACISPSRPKFHYVKITLSPLYKDNNITKTCELMI